jgi:NAD(P)H-hydrate repair Nnr-like enzyme with NAD(P)H-hydrate dehydratase domain
MQASASVIVQFAMGMELPVVLDGDGTSLFRTVVGYAQSLITMNSNEFRRTWVRAGLEPSEPNLNASAIYRILGEEMVSKSALNASRVFALAIGPEVVAAGGLGLSVKSLASQLQTTLLVKGLVDIISNGEHVWAIGGAGSPRRCGGLGDLVAGTAATFGGWARLKKRRCDDSADERAEVCSGGQAAENDNTGMMHAALCASALVRTASMHAHASHGRSMTAPDVLAHIGAAFAEVLDPQ